MCDKAVKKGPYSLQYVRDWFVTREGVDKWHDDYYDDDADHWDDDNEINFLSGMTRLRIKNGRLNISEQITWVAIFSQLG